MKQRTHYVAGFLFNRQETEVVLIRKNRPAWQKGLLNGVGGKIEQGESPSFAMTREFKEETGMNVEGWAEFACLEFDKACVHFFMAHSDVYQVSSLTDEEVNVYLVISLPELQTIPNIQWLIPMALSMSADDANQFTVCAWYGA